MAKEWGGGDLLLIDGVNLSGDISSLGGVNGSFEPIGVTAISAYAQERIGGMRDGAIEMTSYLNPSAGAAHPTFAALPTTDRIATYGRGSTLGGPAADIIAKQLGYSPERGDDGSVTIGVETQANGYGLEWGDQLTAGIDNMTGSGAGTGVDFNSVYGASIGTTAFGLQAWLQVSAFSGTSATVAIQHSTDNGSGDAYANVTGGAFSAASAIGAQRIQTARNASVKRWLRINVTGTFSNLDLMVVVTKNLVETVF